MTRGIAQLAVIERFASGRMSSRQSRKSQGFAEAREVCCE